MSNRSGPRGGRKPEGPYRTPAPQIPPRPKGPRVRLKTNREILEERLKAAEERLASASRNDMMRPSPETKLELEEAKAAVGFARSQLKALLSGNYEVGEVGRARVATSGTWRRAGSMIELDDPFQG